MALFTTLNTSPLTAPVTRAQLRAFRRVLRSSGSVNWRLIVGIVILALFAVPFIFMLVVFVIWATRDNALWVLPLVGLFFGLAVWGIVWLAQGMGKKAFRLAQFAAINGLNYIPQIKEPPLPGMVFSAGHSRSARNIIRMTSPRFVEVANYQYTTGSGKNSTTHHWGYVGIHLKTALPHIVLDSRDNNVFRASNLPVSFAGAQHLKLEGDFNKYFTLYAPGGYEADALYLFTPDVMALVIDYIADMDIELVDDWVFIYSQRKLSTDDPQLWYRLTAIVNVLVTKLDQWERWRDDRLAARPPAMMAPASAPVPLDAPPPTGRAAMAELAPPGLRPPAPGRVATPGRRLQQSRWGIGALLGILMFLLAAAFQFVLPLIGNFFR